MINNPREVREFARMLESRTREGRYRECMNSIGEMWRAGEINRNSLSIRTLFEEVVPDGYAVVRHMEYAQRQGGVLMEAGGDAITTMNFSNIIGQIAYGDVLRAWDNPMFIGDQLVTQVPADTAMPVMVPGITMIGDQAQPVGEGEEYPIVGIGQQFIQYPAITKNGFILAVTEEAVREDKTGLLLDHLGRASESMAITTEKERLSVVLGVTNTYKRNGGAAQNTYGNTHTEGDFDNLIATNPLVDHESFEASDLAFAAIDDPDTGEPIVWGGPRSILVPEGLRWTGWRILNASAVRTGDVIAGDIEITTTNPVTAMAQGGTPAVVSSPYVESVGGSATSWWRGWFKGAFIERVYWPTQVFVEDRNSGVGFSRDIINRTKVRRKTVTAVKEPRYVQKHTA